MDLGATTAGGLTRDSGGVETPIGANMGSAQFGTTWGDCFRFTQSGLTIYSGASVPENVQLGRPGDLYVRAITSSEETVLYYKASGVDTITGWLPLGTTSVIGVTRSPTTGTRTLTGNALPWDFGEGAVAFPSDAEAFVNQADAAASATAFTVMCWVRLDSTVTTDQWRLIWELSEITGGTGAYWYLGVKNNICEFYVYRESDNGEDLYDLPGAWTLGDWHHVALVTDSSDHRCYVDGTLVDTLSLALNAIPVGGTYERIGPEGLTDTHGKFSICQFRRWDAALSTGEVQAEYASDTVVKTANLFRSLPLTSVSGNDESSADHDMSIIGSPQRTVGPA
jgi:hypothetical protein